MGHAAVGGLHESASRTSPDKPEYTDKLLSVALRLNHIGYMLVMLCVFYYRYRFVVSCPSAAALGGGPHCEVSHSGSPLDLSCVVIVVSCPSAAALQDKTSQR